MKQDVTPWNILFKPKNMKIEEKLDIGNVYLKRKSMDSWVLQDKQTHRARWGNAEQIMSDIRHYLQFNCLPRSEKNNWY